MIEKFKKNFAFILIILFAIIAVTGYSTKQHGSPVMVLIKTKGGNVKFTHNIHASDYEIDCNTCHHNHDNDEEKIFKCRKCHMTGMDDNIGCQDRLHKFCIGNSCFDCHHEEGRQEYEWDCKFCHKIW